MKTAFRNFAATGITAAFLIASDLTVGAATLVFSLLGQLSPTYVGT